MLDKRVGNGKGNGNTQQFLHEHRNALRAFAAAQYAQDHNLSVKEPVPKASAVSAAGF